LAPTALASDLKLSGSLASPGPFQPGDELFIYVSAENRNMTAVVSARLKYSLPQKAGEWHPRENLPPNADVHLAPGEVRDLACKYRLRDFFGNGEYKFYVRADIINGTYTYTNLFFNITGANSPRPEFEYVSGEVVKERAEDDLPPNLFNITIVIFLVLAVVSIVRFYRKTRHIEA